MRWAPQIGYNADYNIFLLSKARGRVAEPHQTLAAVVAAHIPRHIWVPVGLLLAAAAAAAAVHSWLDNPGV